MTTIIILNITFAVLVVAGIASLLGRTIATDRIPAATSLRPWAHRSRSHATSGSAPALRVRPARIDASRA